MSARLIDSGDPEWLNATDIDYNVPFGRQIQEVVDAFQGSGYVAGGAARYILVPDAPGPGDIDVFMFGDHIDYSPLTELEYDFQGGVERAPRFSRGPESLVVQVVRPDPDNPLRTGFGPPLEVLSSFTFHTEQAALWKGTLAHAGLLSAAGLLSTQHKVLTNNLISNPVLSIFRLNKYGQKGYSVGMETVMEIVTNLSRLTTEELGDIELDALSMVS